MNPRSYRWAVTTLGLLAMAAMAAAEDADAPRAEAKVEVHAEKTPGDAHVRILVNGKEVKPGEPVPVNAGQVRVEAHVQADDGAADDGPDGKPAARVQSRIEIRTQKDGDEPKVRLWINGKEVDPAENGDAEGTIRFHFEPAGRPDDAEPGKPDIRFRVEGKEFDPLRDLNVGGMGTMPEALLDRGDDEPPQLPPPGTAMLGVGVQPLDDEHAERAKVHAGVVITGTLPGSPAEKAGLEPHDVLLSFDGKPLESPRQLVEMVRGRDPDGEVRLNWSREGRLMQAKVRLAKWQADKPDRPPADEPPPEEEREAAGFLGVMAAPLTDDVREIAGTDRGVLINSLADDSPAAKGGLQPGDVITHVDDAQVNTPGELVEAVRDRRPGDRIHVVYWRMGKRREGDVRLGTRPGKADAGKRPPLLTVPDDLLERMPQLREYMEKIEPQLRQWQRRWNPKDGTPMPAPLTPPMERFYPGARPGRPGREPSPDVGGDLGRILERLERLEKRIDELQQRLEQPPRDTERDRPRDER